ncbi:MAG: pseudouridine synthase [Betaproteobacteria bacterium]|nr:pseudouridine synthase [Betaproteobacteria bacterium]
MNGKSGGKTLTLPKKVKPTPAPASRPANRRARTDGLPPTKPRARGAPASTSTPPAPRPTPSARPVAPAPTRTAPDDGTVRVSKLMSERGLCSRREADAYIERGWVFVDGVKVTELGTRIFATQTITLSRDAQTAQLQSVTILLNKPIGFVSGQPEPGYTPAVTLIVPDNRWKEDEATQRFNPVHLRGLAPAGRLDIDSTGLIVFTQDGRVAKKLIGEDSNVEKEYLVRVEGTLDEGGLKKLNHGLSLDGKALKPAKVSWQNEDQLRFVLREGKKRQIRRMCELVGLKVVGLKRIRIGSVVLGKLPVGQWRYFREDERF